MTLDLTGNVGQEDWGGVPDPCMSLFDQIISQDDHSKGRAWLGQRQRRSDIFAASRYLLTDSDFDSVHIQAIAQHCDLSPQTIYNLVGSKMQVMEQASAEWVQGIRVAALRRAIQADVTAAYTIIEMFWESALLHGGYVRSAARTSTGPLDPLSRVFHHVGISAVTPEIRKLEASGALRENVDIDALARQIIRLTHATIINWCAYPTAAHAYHSELVHGPAAMLRAAMRGPQLARLETYIADSAH